MPFVKQDAREALAQGKECYQVGDICYLAYKNMLYEWVRERRWTTYHNILRRVKYDPFSFFSTQETWQAGANFHQEDILTAIDAAEKVFFNLHVLPYEREMERKNGSI
jgi:hypothetical protein